MMHKKIIFIELLRSTKRKGIENLIDAMEKGGFFTSPCSGSNHLAVEGGLLEHSVNVYNIASNTMDALGIDDFGASLVICSLLHDLGKMGQFGKPNYVPNMVDSRKKDENGEKIYKQSTAKPFETNKELLYVPHEVRSVQIASKYIELTEEESWAILMHNGLYGDFRYDIQGKETPLYMIIHFADMWASRVTEKGDK